ncbi:MAG TPA: hypothetical protein VER36_11280, partial [Flavisolibacter sp.]|nr:hypothetical protein [Flavisolibacter sp.]
VRRFSPTFYFMTSYIVTGLRFFTKTATVMKYLFATLFYLLGTYLLQKVMKKPSAKVFGAGKTFPLRWGNNQPLSFYLGVLMLLIELVVLLKE